MAKVLLIGSGAREHAMAKALFRSPRKPEICCYAAIMHPGLIDLAESYCTGDLCHVEAITAQALNWQVDMAIIGPEAPLLAGLADALWSVGIPVVGPTQALARIETSKFYARELMQRYGILGGPRYHYFKSIEGVLDFLQSLSDGYVIKADGLSGGKGVKVSGEHLHSIEEAVQFCESLVACGMPFLIEEKFIGQEFSLMGFCDGQNVVFMPVVQDHKRAWAWDRGPNTGGMGSYSDANHSLPFLTSEDLLQAKTIFHSVLNALQEDCGQSYRGILYGSFIATRSGMGVIEFNARFGDPEAMNVLAILQYDFVSLCEAMVSGTLKIDQPYFEHRATVCKYAVPEGYPDQPLSHREIDISSIHYPENLYLGSVYLRNGRLYTGPSRTAAVVGIADDLNAAERAAENDISLIQGPLFHREDIGTSMQIQQRITFMQKLRSEMN